MKISHWKLLVPMKKPRRILFRVFSCLKWNGDFSIFITLESQLAQLLAACALVVVAVEVYTTPLPFRLRLHDQTQSLSIWNMNEWRGKKKQYNYWPSWIRSANDNDFWRSDKKNSLNELKLYEVSCTRGERDRVKNYVSFSCIDYKKKKKGKNLWYSRITMKNRN